MTKKPRYEPRVFDGKIIQSDEIERIHKGKRPRFDDCSLSLHRSQE